MWWLHIHSDIDSFIKQSCECQKSSVLPREPLTTTTLLSYLWEKVASDLFHLNNSTYLIVVDYFSRYPEVIQLKSTPSASVTKALKSIFSHHGVPSVFMSDNGSQFVSNEMKKIALQAVRTIPKATGWPNRPSKQSRNYYKIVLIPT